MATFRPLNAFQSPLADSIGVQRRSSGFTTCLGITIYVIACIILIVAAIYYQRQRVVVQTFYQDPVKDQICYSTGSMVRERLYDFDSNTLVILQWNGRMSNEYVSPGVCREWLVNALSGHNDGFSTTEADRPEEFTFRTNEGDCVWPPKIPPDFNVNTTEEFIKETTTNPLPCIRIECPDSISGRDNGSGRSPTPTFYDSHNNTGRQIMMSHCKQWLIQRGEMNQSMQLLPGDVSQPILRADGKQSKKTTDEVDRAKWPDYATTNHSSYRMSYLCRGQPVTIPEKIAYRGGCQAPRLRQAFASSIKLFCDAFPRMNGPYLCTDEKQRDMFDILNLSFAAGSTVTLILITLLRPLHGMLNQPMDAKSTKQVVEMQVASDAGTD